MGLGASLSKDCAKLDGCDSVAEEKGGPIGWCGAKYAAAMDDEAGGAITFELA